MSHPILMDCDPGHDDAIALILALSTSALKPLAVTTSAGNQTQEKNPEQRPAYSDVAQSQ